MFDCANVEIRELLPELVAGRVDASTRARLEAHVRSCPECASELEALRLVRDAFASAPLIDTHRIVAALPKPPAPVTIRPGQPASVNRWVGWRAAAALTMITIGGLSVAVSRRFGEGGAESTQIDSTVVIALPESAGTTAIDTPARSGGESTATSGQHPAPRSVTKAELSFNGGVGDLDDASIQALLGALDEIDRAPVAPSAEPDRSSVLPVIKGDDR